MRVKIEEIQAAGLDLTEPIVSASPTWAVLSETLASAEGFSLVRATPLKASFKKLSGRVHLKGGFTATVTCPCKRCLKDQTLEVPVEFSLRMIEERPRREEPEDDDKPQVKRRARRSHKEDDEQAEVAASFELDEIDAEPFDGKTIDLDPILREQVLLALPVSVVCSEDCKGLCGECGQDLNEQDCGHAGRKPVDARLAVLKDIKLKN